MSVYAIACSDEVLKFNTQKRFQNRTHRLLNSFLKYLVLLIIQTITVQVKMLLLNCPKCSFTCSLDHLKHVSDAAIIVAPYWAHALYNVYPISTIRSCFATFA